MDMLKEELAVEVSWQAIACYRNRHVAQIVEAEKRVYERVIQAGFTRRSERIMALDRIAFDTFERLEQAEPASKGWTQICHEWR